HLEIVVGAADGAAVGLRLGRDAREDGLDDARVRRLLARHVAKTSPAMVGSGRRAAVRIEAEEVRGLRAEPRSGIGLRQSGRIAGAVRDPPRRFGLDEAIQVLVAGHIGSRITLRGAIDDVFVRRGRLLRVVARTGPEDEREQAGDLLHGVPCGMSTRPSGNTPRGVEDMMAEDRRSRNVKVPGPTWSPSHTR